MSDIYKLTFKQKSGLLTELHSDTIFGHFCWRMRDMFGEDKLKTFLTLYKGRSPVFTLSNSFFERDGEIFLPNPLLPLDFKKEQKTKDERIKSFLNYKDSKKRKFLTIEQFNLAITGEKEKLKEIIEKDNIKQPKYIEDLRTSVEISRESFSSNEGQLFSYAPLYINEELVDPKKQTFTETKTVLFVKYIDKNKFDEFNCENILKEVFKIGYGKKKSSGYGEFEVLSYDAFNKFQEPENPNGFITLSNYLPSINDNITKNDSYYDLNIKYGKFGEEFALSENPFKKPIVFMTPGSCFKTDTPKDFYGRCTNETEISDTKPEVIQNGMAFTLRIKI